MNADEQAYVRAILQSDDTPPSYAVLQGRYEGCALVRDRLQAEVARLLEQRDLLLKLLTAISADRDAVRLRLQLATGDRDPTEGA